MFATATKIRLFSEYNLSPNVLRNPPPHQNNFEITLSISKNNSPHKCAHQVSLCVNRGLKTRDVNMGFKFKYCYEIGTFEYGLWKTERRYVTKGRIGSVNPAVVFT